MGSIGFSIDTILDRQMALWRGTCSLWTMPWRVSGEIFVIHGRGILRRLTLCNILIKQMDGCLPRLTDFSDYLIQRCCSRSGVKVVSIVHMLSGKTDPTELDTSFFPVCTFRCGVSVRMILLSSPVSLYSFVHIFYIGTSRTLYIWRV